MGFPPIGPPPGPPIDPMTGQPMMGPPPPMMGPPPPMGPPMGPPPGMPMDPAMMGGPPPPPEPPAPQDPYQLLLDLLRQLVEVQGEDVAQSLLLQLPKEVLDDLLTVVLDNPEDDAFLMALMPEPEKPQYPKWFTIPKKPSKAEVEELCQSDHTEWQAVRDRMTRDLKFLHQEAAAVSDDFDPDYDREYLSPAMSDEVRAIAAMVGSIDPAYEVPWYKPDLEDATQKVEDALYCWDHEAEDQYMRAGNGSYRHDVSMYLLSTGYVCSRIAFDPYSPQNPFVEVLLNPATVVATWDTRGLLRVTRKYTDTVANVLSDFDFDGKLRKKVLKATRSRAVNTNEETEPYRLTDTVEVSCYYDRWWYSVYMDDIDIIPVTKHELGFVPFIIQGSGSGEPSAISDLATNHVAPGRGLSNSRARLVYKHQSHFGHRYKSHAQKEEIF